MNRRRFLGAAGALTALPTASGAGAADGSRGAEDGAEDDAEDGAEPTVSVMHGEYGSRLADVEAGVPVDTFVELPNMTDVETTISVYGQAFDDDEAGHVSANINANGVHLTMELSPERAHRLADEFRLAAEHVESVEGR